MQQSSFNFSIEGIKKIYASGFWLLILVLFFYQIINGNYYRQRAQNNYVRLVPSPAIRGSIFDRNGNLLAYDRAIFNISVIPHQIKNKKDSLFEDLSKFTNRSLISIETNYRRNSKNPFSAVDIIEDIDKITALRLKEKFKDQILINPKPQRYYPQQERAAHFLGYVKEAASAYEKLKKYGYKPLERVGFLGVEQYYDAYLKGQDGGDLIEVDAANQVVGFLGERRPKKGQDIHLTIDSRIQELGFAALGKKNGVVILMDSISGEILALCSLPSFNPNSFISGKNVARLLNNESSPLLNRATQASYSLGSTFKPLIALAALNEGKLKPTKTFLCEGEIKVGLSRFKCWETHGLQNLYQAITHSCNSYFYNLGLYLGPDTLSATAKRFGLDSLTGIDLPYEKKGFVPTLRWKKRSLKQNWFAGDTINFSIGQGFIEATPLENMLAINVFASDGYLVKPRILKKVGNLPSGLPARTYTRYKKEAIEEVKKGLRGVVSDNDGTAALLNNLDFEISGKTGTAQTSGRSHGWFIGYFPYKNSKYTICVFLENGISSYEALKVTYKFLKTISEEELL
ncbi:MAG: penicillin-binding protein 2 [Candidatus Omnitrophica bacterium]|nr:penicillin-binding protein 2 [Candidatus Omnitrophota bacterium]